MRLPSKGPLNGRARRLQERFKAAGYRARPGAVPEEVRAALRYRLVVQADCYSDPNRLEKIVVTRWSSCSATSNKGGN